MTPEEIDELLSGVISWLAKHEMNHEKMDCVYTPLLTLRDRLVPGKYS